MKTSKYAIVMSLLIIFLLMDPAPLLAQSEETRPAASVITSPDAVDNQLKSDQADTPGMTGVHSLKSWDVWKADFAEKTGLSFGFDYNAQGFAATDSMGDSTSASGAFRVFGAWNFFGRGTEDTGGIVFKFGNRHRCTDVAPNEFNGQLGYAGLNNVVFGNQGWRGTHLFWRQGFGNGKGVAYVGYLDATDYTDIYALASPWTGFNNIAFQTGSGTIGGLPDGALGAMVGGFVSDNIYVVSGLADANGDASNLGNGFDTFFDDFETLKTLEVGWTSANKNEPSLFLNNAHVTFWQIDERQDAGTPDGWGVAFSISNVVIKNWLTFIRGGWAEDGGSLYDAAIAGGFGYKPEGSDDLLGVGLHVSHPNKSTFGTDLDEQFTGEFFYKLQVSDKFALTPSIQVLGNPALNPDRDLIAVFGLRARVAF